jgi:hypothetical protein
MLSYVSQNVIADFYLLIDDTTFPLLDRIYLKLTSFYNIHHMYPIYVSGKKNKIKYQSNMVYYKHQQSLSDRIYHNKTLPFASEYLIGFHDYLLHYINDYTSVESCPVLYNDALALSSIIECSGGILSDVFVYGFWSLTHQNPREHGLHKESNIREFRQFDMFRNIIVTDAEMWYKTYYGQLKLEIEQKNQQQQQN